MPRATSEKTLLAVDSILQSLRGTIRTGQLAPGSRLPSEHELCRRYGVKRHTARLTVSALVRERLVDRQAGRGSFVADGKASSPQRGTHTVALLASQPYIEGVQREGWPYNLMLRDMRTKLQEHGLRLLLEMIGDEDSESSVLPKLVSRGYVDGIILAGVAPSTQRYLARHSVPCVMLGQTADDVMIPSCASDNFRIGYEPTAYLLRKGHRRIALVGLDRRVVGWQSRCHGYEMAYHERPLPAPKLLQFSATNRADLDRCVERIIALDCTAVEVHDDELFDKLRYQPSLRDSGWVDRLEWTVLERDVKYHDDLPRVSAMVGELARGPLIVVDKLTRIMEGKNVEQRVTLPFTFQPDTSPQVGTAWPDNPSDQGN